MSQIASVKQHRAPGQSSGPSQAAVRAGAGQLSAHPGGLGGPMQQTCPGPHVTTRSPEPQRTVTVDADGPSAPSGRGPSPAGEASAPSPLCAASSAAPSPGVPVPVAPEPHAAPRTSAPRYERTRWRPSMAVSRIPPRKIWTCRARGRTSFAQINLGRCRRGDPRPACTTPLRVVSGGGAACRAITAWWFVEERATSEPSLIVPVSALRRSPSARGPLSIRHA
jgi:hypothetical protein